MTHTKIVEALRKIANYRLDGHPSDAFFALKNIARAALAEYDAALAASSESGAGERITEDMIDEFLSDYEMRGEDEAGRDACYTPTEGDKALIKDAILGLLNEVEASALPTRDAASERAAPDAQAERLPEHATDWTPREQEAFRRGYNDGKGVGVMVGSKQERDRADAQAGTEESLRDIIHFARQRWNDEFTYTANEVVTRWRAGEFPYSDPAPDEQAKTVPWPVVDRYTGGGSPEGLAARLWVRLSDGPETVEYMRAAPSGMALVPLHPNREMERVMQDEDWQWSDLLAAAGTVSEEDCNEAIRAQARTVEGLWPLIEKYATARKEEAGASDVQAAIGKSNDAANAIRAALASREAQEWKPIETAPTDGRAVLIADANAQVSGGMIAHWFGEWRCCASADEWMQSDDPYGHFGLLPTATHWMPLPASPAAKKEQTHYWLCCGSLHPQHEDKPRRQPDCFNPERAKWVPAAKKEG